MYKYRKHNSLQGFKPEQYTLHNTTALGQPNKAASFDYVALKIIYLIFVRTRDNLNARITLRVFALYLKHFFGLTARQ